ncbi:MAG: hypothetical protein VX026_14340, partial [Myxococcota bacterium]|nr:hypothetical protein [Myxococcota bacterium]
NLVDVVRQILSGKPLEEKKKEEELDPVNKQAVKKKFDDRKDKDIDNDGDVDSSDKYLHKRRKAITKNINKENYEVGTKERRDHTINTTPGQSVEDFEKQVNVMHKKKNSMREALAKMWGIDEKNNINPFDMKKEKKYNGKKEGKTMTGKSETKVEVEPEVNEKKK